MRAFRHLCRASPSVKRPWPTSRSWPSAVTVHTRRHGHFPESACRIPGHARAFSSTRPTRFMLDGESTIYALSTAPGRAAIAVVRISGPGCVSVCHPHYGKPPNAKPNRYTKAFAQIHLSPNPDTQLSVRSMIHSNPQPRTQSSTPAPWSSTFRPHEQ